MDGRCSKKAGLKVLSFVTHTYGWSYSYFDIYELLTGILVLVYSILYIYKYIHIC